MKSEHKQVSSLPWSVKDETMMLRIFAIKKAALTEAFQVFQSKPEYKRYEQLQNEVLQEEKNTQDMTAVIPPQKETVKKSIESLGVMGDMSDLKEKIARLLDQTSQIRQAELKKQELQQLRQQIEPKLKTFDEKRVELASQKKELEEKRRQVIVTSAAFFWKTKALPHKWFFDAIAKNDVEAMQEHYDPALLNCFNRPGGFTPLTWAIQHNRYEAVTWLLGQGANPNLPLDNGMTPLAYAIWHKKDKIFLEALFCSGADRAQSLVLARLDKDDPLYKYLSAMKQNPSPFSR